VEGIETAEQLATLTELGAEYGQGYHLARPTTFNDLEQLLARWPHPARSLAADQRHT